MTDLISTSSVFSLREAARPGLRALAEYWKPFVLIQGLALALVLLYFNVAGVQDICRTLARLSREGGVWIAILASGIAGGIFPEVAKLLTGIEPKPWGKRLEDMGFNLGYFAIVGAQVFYFYVLQAHLWGTGTDALTTIKKVAFDQFVFTAFVSMPFSLTVFSYKRLTYSLSRTLAEVTPGWIARRLPGVVIPAWAFWTPMTAMIYSLPADLQFPLFTLALAAWSLLIVFLAGAE